MRLKLHNDSMDMMFGETTKHCCCRRKQLISLDGPEHLTLLKAASREEDWFGASGQAYGAEDTIIRLKIGLPRGRPCSAEMPCVVEQVQVLSTYLVGAPSITVD